MNEIITIAQTLDEVRKLLITLNSMQIKGCKFVSVKNYENNSGEISNYLFFINADYNAMRKRDMKFLVDYNPNSDIEQLAKVKLLSAFAKNQHDFTRTPQSEAQINAYTHITKSVKVHNETGELYITGYKVSKKVLQKGVYKSVNSSELVKAQNTIKKGFRTVNYRQFTFSKIKSIKMNGKILEFEL